MVLSEFDILGPYVKLTIQKNDFYKSNFGGIATFIFLIIFFLAFFGFGSDLFKREKPTVTFNRILNDEIPSYNLNDNNLLFSIYDQYSNTPIPDFDRRFYVYYDFYSLDELGSVKEVLNTSMEKCSQDVLKKYQSDLYLSPSAYICFARNSIINLKGVISKGANSAVRLQVDFCKNNTDLSKGPLKTNCLSKDDTLKFLSSKRIQMHLIVEGTLIDTNNYETPGKPIAYTASINSNVNSWTRMNLNFKKINVNTNKGFFINDIQTRSYISTEPMEIVSIYSSNTDTIFSHIIGNSQWLEIYNISYIKVQDVFAMMGGFINFSLLVFRFLVEYVSRPDIIDIFNKKYKYLDYGDESINKLHKSITKKYNNRSNSNLKSNNDIQLEVYQQNNIKNSQFNNFMTITRLGENAIEYSNNISSDNTEFESLKVLKGIRKIQNKKYSLNFDIFMRSFRICYLRKKSLEKHKKIYSHTNKKFNKLVSMENLVKLTRYFKLLCKFVLEDHDRSVMKICPGPKNKNEVFEEQFNIFMQSVRDKNKIISRKIADYVKH